MSVDIKANVKQQEIRWLCLTNFYKIKVPSKLEVQCKKGMYFYLILVGIPSILILSIKNRGRGVGFILLNRQNTLSVTKVICGWSLRPKLFLRLLVRVVLNF